MKTHSYEMTVLVKNKPIKEYELEDKIYVEGREGSEFSIKLANHSSQRVLMIPSLDGLSIIDGKPASKQSQGYIVNGNDSITIPGWTLNNAAVAKFVFSDIKKSYANNHPDHAETTNVGVFGCLVYQEHKPVPYSLPNIPVDNWPEPYFPNWPKPRNPIYPTPWYSPITWNSGDSNSSYEVTSSNYTMNSERLSCLRGASGCGGDLIGASMDLSNSSKHLGAACMNSVSQDIGTAFGEKTTFETTSESFQRSLKEPITLVIYYNNRKNLEKLGVDFSRKKHFKEAKKEPNPFPGVGCKRPHHWKG